MSRNCTRSIAASIGAALLGAASATVIAQECYDNVTPPPASAHGHYCIGASELDGNSYCLRETQDFAVHIRKATQAATFDTTVTKAGVKLGPYKQSASPDPCANTLAKADADAFAYMFAANKALVISRKASDPNVLQLHLSPKGGPAYALDLDEAPGNLKNFYLHADDTAHHADIFILLTDDALGLTTVSGRTRIEISTHSSRSRFHNAIHPAGASR